MGPREAWCLFIFTILLLLILATTGCASTWPNRYHESVRINSGAYKGERGEIVGDCSWFENYKVRLLFDSKIVCVKIWQMEAI